MFNKIISTLHWLPHYYGREIRRTSRGRCVAAKHVYFCICDHFEPYGYGADNKTARKIIRYWLEEYPKIADKFFDSDGKKLKYSFFYPEEDYQEEDLNTLAGLCQAGYGDVEVHLHHDNDTPENFRRKLIDFKNRLHEKHGLLSRNEVTGEITYGFIHGNWALNNSRPDGRWCGINNETSILLETGCYADFTMPSAPSDTQTSKVNSIYFAVDIPGISKSHNWGIDAKVGSHEEGLLMVQGPLCLNWRDRKYGLLPRIENSGLYGSSPPSYNRLRLWVNTGVTVLNAPEHVFVKLYTHGAQEDVMRMMFDEGGLETFFRTIQDFMQENEMKFHFVSARELVDKINEIRFQGLINETGKQVIV